MATQLDKIESKIDALHEKFDTHQVSVLQRLTRLETGATVLWVVFGACVTGAVGLVVKLVLK